MKKNIIIKGASEHNLKNIDVTLPRNKLIVFTGVSGSGKSSLAFDTLYAEGQRRYIESLSSYARQFLGQMEKPKVDYIEGLSPAVSIEQKAASHNPRSTVGTVTEIYDYLRVLYARVGTQYCYQCGEPVSSQTLDQMVNTLLELEEGTKIQIMAPLVRERKGEHKDVFARIKREGFVRMRVNGVVHDVNDTIKLDKKSKHNIEVIVDRVVIKKGIEGRLADSMEIALDLTDGVVMIDYPELDKTELYSIQNACPTCNISYPKLTPQMFSFNSPLGMCGTCNGLGTRMELDEDKLVPDKTRSILDGAVVYWGSLQEKRRSWRYKILRQLADEFRFSLNTPWKELSEEARDVILYGSRGKKFRIDWDMETSSGHYMTQFEGLIPTIKRRFRETKSEDMRRMYLGYYSEKPCAGCNGSKLRIESRYVRIHNKSIVELSKLSVKDAYDFVSRLKLSGNKKIIADELVKEIKARLQFMLNVGLHYLALDRSAPTLSGGESERIRLASQIGSGLVGVMYILDEPTIGLHQRDNRKLIDMLVGLRTIGNTVIVVEHDAEMIKEADHVLDFGPLGGVYGGEVVAQGSLDDIINNEKSLTGKYLSGKMKIPEPKYYRAKKRGYITLKGVTQNNLKNIDVTIPLGVLTCVTGVSGSGKSSLVNQTLYPVIANRLYHSTHTEGKYDSIENLESIDKIINITQDPIGRTPRSNPATYTKLFDDIRKIFAETTAAKVRGYKPGRFSFNVPGGRCEACNGNGVKQIEMHFLADVFVTCEVCKGKRFNKETLQIKYKDKNIHDVLNMDVQEALRFFENIPSIHRKLKTLSDVGLDYIKLGQPSPTLSGGEAQRVKLSRELSKTSTGNTLYILDEPTTGLHFHDIKKLISVLNKLVEKGNTIVVIEHNLDVIKCADFVIDLGPEGGDEGGEVVAYGTPYQLAKIKKSYTGLFLKKLFGQSCKTNLDV
ncbi:MAG TPA: excinuclease ABC subunit UvrA [Candidatus Cloacimonetes bacterium]|nr:excinuclease ABC subunit UvrA [Candidatus Cloacimonadota bacterium]HEX38013.1 excinuclease ABC subunit UvrA [Candidatus Cloacimonadota bacterium]